MRGSGLKMFDLVLGLVLRTSDEAHNHQSHHSAFVGHPANFTWGFHRKRPWKRPKRVFLIGEERVWELEDRMNSTTPPQDELHDITMLGLDLGPHCPLVSSCFAVWNTGPEIQWSWRWTFRSADAAAALAAWPSAPCSTHFFSVGTWFCNHSQIDQLIVICYSNL